MARRKEFDPATVLQRAMGLFHHRGYAATSMQDLVEQMEIGRGSLYETFGSKQELFRAALTLYAEDEIDAQIDLLESAADPLAGIADLLHGLIDRHASDCARSGCLVVNTIVELAPHDRELAEFLRQRMQALEQALQRALRRAREGKAPDSDPAALARFVVNAIHGLAVRAKYDADRRQLEQIVEITLRALTPR